MKKIIGLSIAILLLAGCARAESSPKPEESAKVGEIMIKKTELAGSWFPGTERELRAMVEGFIEKASPPKIDGRIVGIISPHAGLVHSGATAAFGFKTFALDRGRYSKATVVMIGLNHRNPGFDGISVWAKGAWESPLGRTAIDEALADSILVALGKAGDFNQAIYRGENSLETQLPFIQFAFGPEAKIVPIIFGRQSVEASMLLAEVLARHSSRKDIVIVASTDLSHFHDVGSAKALDDKFIDAVVNWNPDSLLARLQSGRCEACGFGAVLTLMLCAKSLGADTVLPLKYSTSADGPYGDPSSVVGYFSAAFVESKTSEMAENKSGETNMEYSLTDEQKTYLLKLARRSIADYISGVGTYEPQKPADPKLAENGAVFVTLHRDGRLRGCIGQMVAQGPLYLAVRDMAISAAVNDHRFRPVTMAELPQIDIEISVLSPMQPIDDWRKIEIGKHGVWLRKGYSSGVFLPQVGKETGWSREEFLEELSSQKAGLHREAYKDPSTKLYIFTVVEFDEHALGLR